MRVLPFCPAIVQAATACTIHILREGPVQRPLDMDPSPFQIDISDLKTGDLTDTQACIFPQRQGGARRSAKVGSTA